MKLDKLKHMLHGKFSLKKIILLLAIAVIIGVVLTFYKVSQMREELFTINKVAKEYFDINKNYGIITNDKLKANCFGVNSFVKDKRIEDIILSGEVSDMGCRFETENNSPLINSWSVSILVKEKVYCTDSTGNMKITPGFTITTSCDQ